MDIVKMEKTPTLDDLNRKYKKKTLTNEEKYVWLYKQVMLLQIEYDLQHWKISMHCDGDWGNDGKSVCRAKILPNVKYLIAKLTFHEKVISSDILYEESIMRTIRHELLHLLNAPMKKKALDVFDSMYNGFRIYLGKTLDECDEQSTHSLAHTHHSWRDT